MDRRGFLRAGLVTAGGLVVGDGFWRALFAAQASDGDPHYGSTADSNGILLPDGYTSRVIARSNQPVVGGHVYPVFPDGAHAFPTDEGGWILVVNSENPPPADFPTLYEVQDQLGGASAIRFDTDGDVVDAYWVLRGTRSNCSGGPTPWGTWLSCEEFDRTGTFGDLPGGSPSEAGRVWECIPTDRGGSQARVHEALGRFKHEAAAFDDTGRVYLTEDTGDGCLYRFTPARVTNTSEQLAEGALEALAADPDGGRVAWVPVPDPAAQTESTRHQAQANGATVFDGGEGCFFAPHDHGPGGRVYFTTKGDDHVRAVDTRTGKLEVVYAPTAPESPLRGVDNLIVSPWTGHVYVVEDGGDMEVVRIENPTGRDPIARPFLRFTGPQHGLVDQPNPTPLPLESEVTSPTISPDGTRFYASSQREAVFGATYEILAPPGAHF